MKLNKTLFFCFLALTTSSAYSQVNNDSILKYIEHRDYVSAVRKCNEILMNDISSGRIWYYKGIALQGMQRYSEALASYERTVDDSSYYPSSSYRIAECYESLNDISQAIKQYSDVLERDSTDLYSIQQKARLLIRLKNYEDAAALYKKLLKKYPENYLFNKNLGICYYHINKERQAARHLITAWNKNKRDLSLPVSIANAWARLKMPDKAMIALKDGLARDSTNIPILKTAGSISYSMGSDQRAADYFQKAYNYGDTSEFVYKYLGISYFNLSRYEEAIPYLQGYYSYDSLNTEATYYLGLALASWHYKEEGISMLQKTIDLSYPDSSFISSLYVGMAVAKADINQRDLAIEYYFKAIELDPDNTTCYIEVARLYDGKARIEKESTAEKLALKYYEKFLAMEQKRKEVIMEQTGLEADKISIPGYDYAKRRVKEIKEELFFRGELEK